VIVAEERKDFQSAWRFSSIDESVAEVQKMFVSAMITSDT